MIKELITNKSRAEANQIKATELVKLGIKGLHTEGRTRIKTDIQLITKFGDNGLEVLARAWKGTKRYGFGRDGRVDIERFRIINPALSIPDGGTKIIKSKSTGENLEVSTFVENPHEALRRILAETIQLTGTLDSPSIIENLVGSTTLTAFPYNDGEINHNDATAVWSTVRDAATATEVFDTINDNIPADNSPSCRENGSYDIFRTAFTFDTSSIGTDDIDSAVFSVYPSNKLDGDNDGDDYIGVVSFSPADEGAYATGDYDAFGTTEYASGIDIGSITTGAYNDWTFNATGEAAINKSGYTNLGQREGHDIIDSPIADSTNNRITTTFSDTAGTTQDPKLVVTHSAATVSFIPKITII